MRAAVLRAPAGAQARLDRARLALKLAEERTGLRDSPALEVQRAVSSLSAATSAGSSSTASLMALTVSQDSGVLSLQGSTTLLLAALALRQGGAGWCGVIGGEDLGWCAATEVGLDLKRVLSVPVSVLDDVSVPTVASTASTLLDGVDALLIDTPSAERLRPQHRRRLLARARERGRLILTPAPWEGARTLRAGPLTPDTGAEGTAPVQPPTGYDGVVVPIGQRGSSVAVQAVEMPAGYLRGLAWTLTDPQRPRLTDVGGLALSLSAEGLRTCSHDATEPSPGPQEAVG